MRSCAILFALALSAVGGAEVENPQLFPFGEREVLTGNAGVAGSPSSGAVVYNPAGLALIEHSSLSVSGSTYIVQNMKAAPLFRIDGTDLEYTASGFETIPASVISVTRSNDWALAFAVLVPESLKLNNRLSFSTPNTSTTIHQIQTNSDLWLTASYAKQLGADWAAGITLFAIQKSQASAVTLTSRNPATPALPGVSHNDFKSSVINVAAAIGLRWKASPSVDLGFRARLPAVRLMGSGDGYKYEQSSNGTALTVNDQEAKDMDAYSSLPLDVALGACWHLGESVRLLTDVSLQAGTTFDLFPGTEFSNVTTTDARARYNVGLEVSASPELILAAGLLFNPSAKPAANQAEGDIRQDFTGLTAGVTWQSDRVRTGIGLFYFWSTGTFVPFNNPTGTGQFTQRGLGATLVFSYSLGDKVALAQ